MDFIRTLTTHINGTHNHPYLEYNLEVGKSYIILLEDTGCALLAKLAWKGAASVTFQIVGQFIENVMTYFLDQDTYYVPYHYCSYYDCIEINHCNHYSKCKIYLLTAGDLRRLHEPAVWSGGGGTVRGSISKWYSAARNIIGGGGK